MPLNKTDIFILIPSNFLKAVETVKEIASIPCVVKDG